MQNNKKRNKKSKQKPPMIDDIQPIDELRALAMYRKDFTFQISWAKGLYIFQAETSDQLAIATDVCPYFGYQELMASIREWRISVPFPLGE